jgi:hypothetical protein
MTLSEVFAELPSKELNCLDENEEPIIDPKNTFLNYYLIDNADMEMDEENPDKDAKDSQSLAPKTLVAGVTTRGQTPRPDSQMKDDSEPQVSK